MSDTPFEDGRPTPWSPEPIAAPEPPCTPERVAECRIRERVALAEHRRWREIMWRGWGR